MCGICGFISKKEIKQDQLIYMNNQMIHRGPDDSGAEIYNAKDGYTIGFAHRRLSILDLSILGHQPMHSSDNRISVVFNGEIYNFKELKKELHDYPFHSNCDTEVIIAAYLKWGISCLDKFNGMFAIALYDRENGNVFLARDRIGKKPLYYWLDDKNLVFASELKPIMCCPGFTKTLRKEILPRFLYQQYIASPDTIFENVYKLEPGAVLTFENGKTTIAKYWDIKKIYHTCQQNPITDYSQAKQELKGILKKAVSSRMIADVPLGSFLSGGYDSSLITAIAQEYAAQPLKTFSIGFEEEQYNEAKYAKEVATYLGTEHTEAIISESEMLTLVESIAQYYDEPFADSSQIPTMLVAKLAKKDVTVALSGDGGDEFFCGYNIYENVSQAQHLDALGGLIHLLKTPLPKVYQKLPFRVRVVADNRDIQLKTQFGSESYLLNAQSMVKTTGLNCRYPIEKEYNVKNWQIRRMLLDMDTYLPDDILCKVDRASMKYSLESRCPILDKDVMEYSFRMDHSLKFANGIKKRILKDIAYDYIPKELLDRPKVGFGVPLSNWMRGPLREQLLAYADRDFLRRQDIFNVDYTASLIEKFLKTGDAGPATGANFSKAAWSFFVFQQWYCYHMQ